MARQETFRRTKSYSAASGFVYQYVFHEVRATLRGLSFGTEYIYMVSADRKTMFPMRVFVRRESIDRWAKQVGRSMSGAEEYAVAKMRLFRAFDEVDDLAVSRPDLVVDDSNLESLLVQLGI